MSIYTKIIDLQKLDASWSRVRKNKPAAGVDGITVEQFDEARKEELKQLHIELRDHTYQVLPVKLVNLYKGEKVRTIALYSMRDKVVQQSIASEMNTIFDTMFSAQTYAYRNDKSAIIAIGEIDEKIRSREYDHFLKVDITHFFDNMVWEILSSELREHIQEDDVIDLIRQNSCGVSLDADFGELVDKRVGVYQGSCIAPVLSNVYMMKFDNWMCSQAVYFVRYSDDMLILGNDADYLVSLLQEIKLRFEALGLAINDSKSVIGSIAEGFEFLGYHFDLDGKAIPSKAESNLADRLEMMWLTSGNIEFEAKLKKVMEIVGGWEQYFRGERVAGTIFEYVALIYLRGSDPDSIEKLLQMRPELENIYHDIAEYLANYWRGNKEWERELYEYEQFFRVPMSENICLDDKTVRPYVHELLKSYRQYIIREDYDLAIEIMQSYTDLREYSQAQFWQEIAGLMKKRQETVFDTILKYSGGERDIIFHSDTPGKILRSFVGREDLHAREIITDRSGRKVEPELRPVNEQIIKDHLSGKITADTYIQRPNATVRFMVVDVDISKSVLLQYDRGSDEYRTYLQKAYDQAMTIKTLLEHYGLNGYIEYSGCRGYHVWLFFNEWLPSRYANMLSEIIEGEVPVTSGISVEYFPNKTRIKEGKYGQAIKIPYGIHTKTGERSYFLDNSGNPIMDVDLMTDTIAKAAIADVKQVIAGRTGINDKVEQKEVDTDISAFGDIEPGIREVLMGCSLLRHLCLKSVKTGYLTHYERLTVLYVFGHLGEEGQSFVHKVMSFTLNYKYNVTENFIRKMPEKPISCVKLRDQYKQLTAEIGCSCSFKRSRNCYPSPVLHAIALSPDMQGDVTLPSSRTLTKDSETKVKAEMNVHSKAQELASKILEFKKQKRSIDKSIHKLEKELSEIFDTQNVDCMEIEMGMLTRRKTDAGYEWIIEI